MDEVLINTGGNMHVLQFLRWAFAKAFPPPVVLDLDLRRFFMGGVLWPDQQVARHAQALRVVEKWRRRKQGHR